MRAKAKAAKLFVYKFHHDVCLCVLSLIHMCVMTKFALSSEGGHILHQKVFCVYPSTLKS